MLLGEIEFAEAVRLLDPAGHALGREVSPKTYTMAQWRKAVAGDEPFVHEVLARAGCS